MLCYDENVIYAAKNDTKVIVFFQVKKMALVCEA